MISNEELRYFLHYDQLIGLFLWKNFASKTVSKVGIGCFAGNIHSQTGHVQIGIKGKRYLAHRLAWQYVTGEVPTKVDHINRIPWDNSFANLRLCNQSQNMANSLMMKSNTSGVRGVSWDKSKNKWSAKISINKKTLNLGRFDDIEDAAEAYKQASLKYHGNFSPFV